MIDAVVILSGGMDSTTLAYYLKAQGKSFHCLTFDYGQRHSKELESASVIARALDVPHTIIDISTIKPLLHGSALTGAVDVPHGHYAAENMKLTIVPNRNAIMLSLAYAYAISAEAQTVAYAAHAGDHFVYPDCRPDFVSRLEAALQSGNDSNVRIEAPFLHLTKGHVAALGKALRVPYDQTWTCYEGGAKPCGECGACVERQEAMQFASDNGLKVGA